MVDTGLCALCPRARCVGSPPAKRESARSRMTTPWYTRADGLLWALGLLVGSFVATQLLLVCLQRKRLQRIEAKSLELCGGKANAAVPGTTDRAVSTRRVPVTLITGFLGSGKTTLVNRLLSADHGLRIVVIENELGSVSIDHELIDRPRQEGMPEGVIVLKNGCMCCSGETPGGELERVLDKMLEMARVEGGSLPFDCLLIETSGLADPSPIVQVLCRHEMSSSCYYLDAVLAMVDCKHVMRHLRPSGPMAFTRRRPEAEKQLALSDRVLLNKADLASEDELAAVGDAVRSVNASAALLPATRAHVPLDQILGLHAFSSARWEAALSAAPALSEEHAAAVGCVCMQSEEPLTLPALQAWLQPLLAARHDDVYRVKGVLSIAGDGRRFVLHGVHAQVTGQFERAWRAGEARVSTLVVIGHRLNEQQLRAGFARAVQRRGEGAGTEGAGGEGAGIEGSQREGEGGGDAADLQSAPDLQCAPAQAAPTHAGLRAGGCEQSPREAE